jgi:membrane protease YdiL (CAAX protease family)
MIRQDYLSLSLTALAVALLLYLSTFGTELLTKGVFITVIALAGLVLSRVFKVEGYDEDISASEGKQILMYVALSLAAIFAVNILVPQVTRTYLSVSPITAAQSLAVMIAVAEEQFFRGFFLNLFISKVGEVAGAILSSAVFMLYHFAVYGTNPTNLIIVFGGGLALAYAAIKTRRVSTPMIAHVVNNFLATWR